LGCKNVEREKNYMKKKNSFVYRIFRNLAKILPESASGSTLDPDPHSSKLLDPDPYPHITNADPKH
jgi:hypothetical protein